MIALGWLYFLQVNRTSSIQLTSKQSTTCGAEQVSKSTPNLSSFFSRGKSSSDEDIIVN